MSGNAHGACCPMLFWSVGNSTFGGMRPNMSEMFRRLSTEAGRPVSPELLWDQDMRSFDFRRSRVLVVQRIIERGRPEDFLAAFALYGGEDGFREIIKQVPHLSPRDMNFVCVFFGLKKRELKCYHNAKARKLD